MKYYIISGGGSGIGRAIAQRLSKDNGNHILIVGRRGEPLSETLTMLENSQNHRMMVANIMSLENLQEAAKNLSFPALDGIIANAGLGGANHFGPGDRWNEIISTNLSGTYNFVNVFLPLLKKSGNPYKHIVIMASVLARLGVPGYSAYCASKAGLLGLMRSWAVELAKEKILVNAICPGWVDTEMSRTGIEEIARRSNTTFEQSLQEAMRQVPLRKMAKPEEIADLVRYLVSQTSLTGQTMDINNGAVMNS
jgi:NAD(P)-dependent dehydrogenase (short-subunit alcohol dehydrogenase family)